VGGWVGGGMGGWVGGGRGQEGVKVLSSRGWVRGKTRGEYRFMKLMKLKKKGKITLSFTSPEKHYFFVYDAIVKKTLCISLLRLTQ
jgi:predicted RNA binding protein YcfA (HicA-like mRNA interferase family)